jgi:hypothetical protein
MQRPQRVSDDLFVLPSELRLPALGVVPINAFLLLSLFESIPIDRIHLVNPGEELDVGDRKLLAWRPPSYDNPSTTGFYDAGSRTLFSSDYFGALLEAAPPVPADLSDEQLRRGQILWATVDAPWLALADPAKLGRELDAVRRMAPRWIMSAHLPPAEMRDAMLDNLAAAASAPPIRWPDQAALIRG